MIAKLSTTELAYTDSSTLTYSITRHTTRGGGGYFAAEGDKPCFVLASAWVVACFFTHYYRNVIQVMKYLFSASRIPHGHTKLKPQRNRP